METKNCGIGKIQTFCARNVSQAGLLLNLFSSLKCVWDDHCNLEDLLREIGKLIDSKSIQSGDLYIKLKTDKSTKFSLLYSFEWEANSSGQSVFGYWTILKQEEDYGFFGSIVV